MTGPRWWQRGTIESPPLWVWRLMPPTVKTWWFNDRKMRRHHCHTINRVCVLPDCPRRRS